MNTLDVHPAVLIHSSIYNILFRIYMDTDFTRGKIKKKIAQLKNYLGNTSLWFDVNYFISALI